MSYKIKATSYFEQRLKKLAKKYPSLKKEYPKLIAQLKKQPDLGTSIGHSCFKIRIAIASKGKGKSGGARVITYFKLENQLIVLLTIYSKGRINNITNKELLQLIKEYQANA